MMNATRIARMAALVGASALLLSACGGNAADKGAGSASGAPAKGNGELVVGALLPQTGSLAFLGPPEFAGVKLAVKEINEAGGVNGKSVKLIEKDSGDQKTDIASQSVDALNNEKTDVIIGAASSAVSKNVIEKVTGNGMLMVSPANTAPDFTDWPDKNLYWRTAPSDVLQGRVLGEVLFSDGKSKVAIMQLDDPYGRGLADNVKKSVENAGGGKVVEHVVYSPDTQNFSGEVSKIKASNPDAIVVIGFDETKSIVTELVAQQVGPAQKSLYFVDGNLSNTYTLPPGTLKGVKGTQPGSDAAEDFKAKLLTVDPALKDFSYSGEAYDATMLSALAAIAAKDDSGAAMATKMAEVSRGGKKCTKFAECKKMLEAGDDIDYDGQSGPIEFSDKGDPTQATIGIFQYGDDNKYTKVRFQLGKLDK